MKKDMEVNLDDNTIFIPELGSISIDLIYDAYERIQQRKGIDAAQANGTHMGRPIIDDVPEEFITVYNQVEAKMITATEAANKIGISRSTYYRMKERYEKSYK